MSGDVRLSRGRGLCIPSPRLSDPFILQLALLSEAESHEKDEILPRGLRREGLRSG